MTESFRHWASCRGFAALTGVALAGCVDSASLGRADVGYGDSAAAVDSRADAGDAVAEALSDDGDAADAADPSCFNEGQRCAVDRVCHDGVCTLGCWFGQFVGNGEPVPDASCRSCDAFTSVDAWMPAADGNTCDDGVCLGGACAVACFIDGIAYEPYDHAPGFPCLVCDPQRNATMWSVAIDGAACGDGKRCGDGQCMLGCLIDGHLVASGDHDPTEPCRMCDRSRATDAWSPVADGVGCGDARTCQAGVCSEGCWVDGQHYAFGAYNVHDECQTCEREHAPFGFTDVAWGTACDGGLCGHGICQNGCLVGDDLVVLPYTDDPSDACRWCDPHGDHLDYDPRPDGVPCGFRKACVAGACVEGCVADGAVYAPGDLALDNPCLFCDPSFSTHDLATVPDGTPCLDHEVCASGACVDGCVIDGKLYQNGTIQPGVACRACRPELALDAWSPRADGTNCGFQMACSGGECVAP
ncbi:MAG: hypothetical protein U1F43_25870 [Myxococcota bacterium]